MLDNLPAVGDIGNNQLWSSYQSKKPVIKNEIKQKNLKVRSGFLS